MLMTFRYCLHPSYCLSHLLQMLCLVIGFYGVFYSTPVMANNQITNYRIFDHPSYTRFVIDMTGDARYSLSRIKNPERVVIDMHGTTWQAPATSTSHASHYIRNIRHAQHKNRKLRIVIDLTQTMMIKKAFILPPKGGDHFRFVIDLTPSNAATPPPKASIKAAQPKKTALTPKARAFKAPTPAFSPKKRPISTPKKKRKARKKPLIVIDPGHGGKDSGALGRVYRKKEKHITLSYGLALKRALAATHRYRVLMTRYDDRYIPLRKRVEKARNAKGDLFLSLHADSHPKASVRGFSVYTLSERASDKDAARLARHANKGDILHRVDLSHEQADVANVLINLISRETRNNSSRFAEALVSSLSKEVKLLKNTHRFAGFRVLKGIEVPAVLIELGYLSNRYEEKLLGKAYYQQRIVRGIVQAIDRHFAQQRAAR